MIQTKQETMGDIWPEVRRLGIGVPRSLNPPPDLPLRTIEGVTTPVSGERVGLTEVEFEYRGPEIRLAVGWGLKPAGAGPYADGAELIPGAWNWHFIYIIGFEIVEWQLFSTVQPQGVARVTIPYAGEYLTRGGYTRRLNVGAADTWVWMTDYSLAVAMREEEGYINPIEHYILLSACHLEEDTDADVVELEALLVADVRELEVRYSL